MFCTQSGLTQHVLRKHQAPREPTPPPCPPTESASDDEMALGHGDHYSDVFGSDDWDNPFLLNNEAPGRIPAPSTSDDSDDSKRFCHVQINIIKISPITGSDSTASDSESDFELFDSDAESLPEIDTEREYHPDINGV